MTDDMNGESGCDVDFDGYGTPGELLIRVLLELGLDDGGHPVATGKHYRTMEPTDRGARFTDGHGRTLMITRGYWWADCDTDEDRAAADLPNLEIPPLGITVSWYKHAFRDSMANVSIDADMVARIRDLMKPCLDEVHDDVEHPYDVDITWTTPRTAIIRGNEMCDKARISADGGILIISADERMTISGHEDSLADAHEWVRLIAADWR